MNEKAARQFIRDLYIGILGREARDKELMEWTFAAISRGPEEVVRAFLLSAEYEKKNAVTPFFHNGHYYSPVVDPHTVRDYVTHHRKDEIVGIEVSISKMLRFWSENAAFIRGTPFEEEKNGPHRFYYANSSFPYGDAIVLRAMIGHHKPRKIVEVGSGFSSACMLDSAEHAGLVDFHLTCIDPETDRLRGVLRTSDHETVTIIEQPIQEVSLDVFRTLEPGDILFIDSTHVLKTGSDVHYELFSVLPALRDGVLIHFHDIQYPFEYPDEWIFERNYSWNEIYALRAFLMYNTKFQIQFWNGFFAYHCREAIDSVSKVFMKNPGGSVWIKKLNL